MLFDSFLSPIVWWDWKLNPALRRASNPRYKGKRPLMRDLVELLSTHHHRSFIYFLPLYYHAKLTLISD